VAAEYAVLDTGFRIRAGRHEAAGDRVRLFLENGGVIEFPAVQVVWFEREEVVSFAREEYVEPASPVAVVAKEQPFDLDAAVRLVAEANRLPEALIHSVIAAESAYDPAAVSAKGAIGLMQLMPETARELAVNPLDPGENVRGGVSYLRNMLERYAGTDDQLVQALAAYNAGPGVVDRHGGLPPYAETRLFVRRVIERFLSLAEAAAAK
jgi:soluble lytic murein transglycosylase-like protein